MKLLSILIITFALSACGMEIEEYNARVKYCQEMQAAPKASGQAFVAGPANVYCEKDGIIFRSKEAK